MTPFGPFAPDLPEPERLAGFRELRALAFLLLGGAHPLVTRLAEAETDAGAAADALSLLDRLPPLPMRRLLSTWMALRRGARPSGPAAAA